MPLLDGNGDLNDEAAAVNGFPGDCEAEGFMVDDGEMEAKAGATNHAVGLPNPLVRGTRKALIEVEEEEEEEDGLADSCMVGRDAPRSTGRLVRKSLIVPDGMAGLGWRVWSDKIRIEVGDG